ncbi:hypothetical protein ACRAWD_26310 [Caulobacter segnis]
MRTGLPALAPGDVRRPDRQQDLGRGYLIVKNRHRRPMRWARRTTRVGQASPAAAGRLALRPGRRTA